MIGIFFERSDSESPKKVQKSWYSDLLGEFDGRDINTLRESLSKSDFSFVREGIIFRLVGVVFAGFICDGEIENRTLGSEFQFFECEEIRKRFNGGSWLTKCECGIDLSGGGFVIVSSTNHHTKERVVETGLDLKRPVSFCDYYTIIAHISPGKFCESIFRECVDLFCESTVKSGRNSS